MQIIQNVLQSDLTFNPNDKVITFFNDKLVGKKINAIYLTGVPYTGPVLNPPRPNPYVDTNELINLGLYLNLFDINGKAIVENLAIENLFLDETLNNRVELPIDCVLDLNKSHFFYRNGNVTRKALLRVYFIYQTKEFQKTTDLITGIYTVKFPYKSGGFLKDFFGFAIKNQKIKRIKTDFPGSFYLVGRDFEINCSSKFFNDSSPKQFLVDNLEIDYEKSTFKDSSVNNSPDNSEHHITFIF